MNGSVHDSRTGVRILHGLVFLLFLAGFGLFYTVYVPLVPGFQIILAPLLVLAFLLALTDPEKGLPALAFMVPLINALPNFFGLSQIPHAPTALVLLLVFFGGWLGRRIFVLQDGLPDSSTLRPLWPFAILVIVSGLITFLRHANFFPFQPGGFRELIVNTNAVRAGGAAMSTVFTLLFYLSGAFVFAFTVRMFRSAAVAKRTVHVLAGALAVSLVFAVVQKVHPACPGNSPFWIGLGQINATFKDPNSFAVFLGLFLPLMLGLAIAGTGLARVFFASVVVLGLAVFPFIGSRSALLGLGFSLGLFIVLFLSKGRPSIKGRLLRLSLVASGLAVLGLILLFLFRNAVLTERSFEALRLVQRQDSLGAALGGRSGLWRVAWAMVRDYPLTGIGLGSYIIELPNYGQQLHTPLFQGYTDSAENFYLHVAAELGLLGLALCLWLFASILKRMASGWRALSGRDPCRLMFLGAASGLAGFFVNLFFHSYMASYEVYFGFWIIAAIVFACPRPSDALEREGRRASPRAIRIGILLAILAFGGVHLWNSTHSLSISSRTREFGWNQEFGLYPEEKDSAAFSFRWSQRTAGFAVKWLGPEIVIPLLASHPDIERRPVTLRIFFATADFKKRALLREVVFNSRSWRDVSWKRTPEDNERSYFVLETERDWQPKRVLGADDSRWLAVAVGEIWFRYPEEAPGEGVESVQLVPLTAWEGRQKNFLGQTGRAKVHFRARGKSYVRLHLKGRPAFGIGPLIRISLDGTLIAKTFIQEQALTSLLLPGPIQEGDHLLEVVFVNDISRDGQDRNVGLGDVEVILLQGTTRE